MSERERKPEWNYNELAGAEPPGLSHRQAYQWWTRGADPSGPRDRPGWQGARLGYQDARPSSARRLLFAVAVVMALLALAEAVR